MAVVYYSKRIQITISQGKRCMGQSPRDFHMQSFQLASPSGVVDSTNFLQPRYVKIYNEYCQQGGSPETWCPEFLLGLDYVHIVDSHMADLSLQTFQRSS